MSRIRPIVLSCLVVSALAAAVGCGAPQGTPPDTSGGTPTAAETAAPDAEQLEADLAAREKELELKEKELELARREQALEQSAAKPAAPRPAAPKPAAAPPAAPAVNTTTSEPPKPAYVEVQVPAGTELSIALATALSTKTATVGAPVEGTLANDLVIDGRRVAAAGARVTGTVTSVVSTKNKVGGKASLGLAFDSLELSHGAVVNIAATMLQQGKSDTGKDAAKIAGGAAAGAILGHQVDDDGKGKVIGGLVGGALGTLAAAKTGGDFELTAGTVVAVPLDQALEVRMPR